MDSQNIPKVGELVIATVAKISKFGAYCKLPEYNDLEVFLPIREVSSGWIKNIREHIHEGQKLVCSVTFYDKDKGTIDISLKRVSPGNSKEKIQVIQPREKTDRAFPAGIEDGKRAAEQGAAYKARPFRNSVPTPTWCRTQQTTHQNLHSPSSRRKLKEAIIKVLEVKQEAEKVSCCIRCNDIHLQHALWRIGTQKHNG